MELSFTQKRLLQFCKDNDFHATLQQFIDVNSGLDRDSIIEEFHELKRCHIASAGHTDFDGFIGVTNYGWKLMGWSREQAYNW